MPKIKVCPSHVKVYEYLVGLVKKTGSNDILIGYHDIAKALKLSYPIVAKCMPQLAALGCIKLNKINRGRNGNGSSYTIDPNFKAVIRKYKKEKVYKIRWNAVEINFVKISC